MKAGFDTKKYGMIVVEDGMVGESKTSQFIFFTHYDRIAVWECHTAGWTYFNNTTEFEKYVDDRQITAIGKPYFGSLCIDKRKLYYKLEKPLEITIADIAKKFGVKVSQIKIVDKDGLL